MPTGGSAGVVCASAYSDMICNGEFIEGQFVERHNRFLLLVRMGDREERAHLPNPGRIKALIRRLRPITVKLASKCSRQARSCRIFLTAKKKRGTLCI